MSTHKLSNITISEFREFLQKVGCNKISVEGSHEKWARKDLLRPIILQTHKEPIPEFIVKNNLRNLGISKKEFFNIFFDISENDNPLKKKDIESKNKVMNDDELCFCGSGKLYKDCHGKNN